MSAYLEEIFGLSGRLAVVTGGSSGIGRAMAVALGRAGARIVLVAAASRAAGRGGRGAGRARRRGGARSPPTSPIVRRSRRRSTQILAGYGDPDVLVNAAAVNRRPPLDRLTEDDWDVTLAANLTAPFLLGQAFGPRMAARGWGRIINVVSQQAFRAYGNSGAYGVSKAGPGRVDPIAGRGLVAERRLLQRGRARRGAHPADRGGVRRPGEGGGARRADHDRP